MGRPYGRASAGASRHRGRGNLPAPPAVRPPHPDDRTTTINRNRRQRHRLAALATCALLLAPLAAACSSDSDADPARTTTTTSTTNVDDTTTTTTGDDPAPGPTTTEPEATTTTTAVEDPAPSGDEQAYVDALVATFTSDENEDLPLEREQAECVAPRWVRALGVDAFTEAGITPESLTPPAATGDEYFDVIDEIGTAEAAKTMAESLADCDVDLVALVADLVSEDGKATDDQASCFATFVSAESLEKGLAAAIDGEPGTDAGFDESIDQAQQACFGGGNESDG